MIVDTHCHLDDEKFAGDIEDVIARAHEQGVGKIIIPGADMGDLARAREIAEAHEQIYFAVGVHPYHSDEFDIDYLESLIEHPKCVAVGECGLDYYRIAEYNDDVTEAKRRQKEVFTAQIHLAITHQKPLIVHIREANQDSYDILREYEGALVGGVLHCYNASDLLLNLKDKFYYGIGGVLTFKNGKALKSVISQIPRERLLLETDAPYLAPEPHRGTRNEPAYTSLVAREMSALLGEGLEHIQQITTENANNLFQI